MAVATVTGMYSVFQFIAVMISYLNSVANYPCTRPYQKFHMILITCVYLLS